MDVHCLFFQPRDDFQGRFESSVAVLPETLGYPLPYPLFQQGVRQGTRAHHK